MKYIWVTHEAKISGANKCMLEVIETLIALGHNCEVVVTRKQELADALINLGVKVHILLYYGRAGKLNIQRLKMYLRNIYALFQLTKLIKKREAEKIITNTITVGIGAWAAFFAREKHIWYVHEFGKEDHGILFPFGETVANKLIGRLSEKVIVVSNALKEKYSKYIKKDKIKVLYNYPKVQDIIQIEENKDDSFKLLMVGQIAKGKRQDDALKAVNIIVSSELNVSLIILGNIVDEKYFEQLKEYCRINNIEKNVHFKGFVSNPYQYIKNADIMLVCSKAEAFGRTTIEAMMLGTPVIGADSGATTELIEDNKTGLLYECCNPEDLAEKIQKVYNNKELLTQIAKKSQQFISKRFDNINLLEEVEEIFN